MIRGVGRISTSARRGSPATVRSRDKSVRIADQHISLSGGEADSLPERSGSRGCSFHPELPVGSEPLCCVPVGGDRESKGGP